ncbi:MAG: DedA family protein [Myxococcaceae bacterium]
MDRVAAWVVGVVDSLGYIGLVLLLALENVFPPLPSELILPLAGFLTGRGEMSFLGAVFASTTGALVGALVLYALGRLVGEGRIRRFVVARGRWFMFEEEDLDRASAFFARYGSMAVFFGRLVPVVRSVISIPAGVRRMRLPTFCLFTALGSFVWNTALIGLGWILGDRWESVRHYVRYLEWLVMAAILLGLVWFMVKRSARRRRVARG